MKKPVRYFGIDLGGTNLRIGEVDLESGKIIGDLTKVSSSEITKPKDLADLVLKNVPRNNGGQDVFLGICAAGTIEGLNITQASNSAIPKNNDFAQILSDGQFFSDVALCNDIDGAALAEASFGAGKGHENVVVATYSTGFNCALVRNEAIQSNAEAGHMPYSGGLGLRCGCGGLDHLECYVSGGGAVKILEKMVELDLNERRRRDSNIRQIRRVGRTYHSITPFNRFFSQDYSEDLSNLKKVLEISDITSAAQVYDERVRGNELVSRVLDIQQNAIADSFGIFCSMYNPVDAIVCMGSQTKDWDLIFEGEKGAITRYLAGGRQHPNIKVPNIYKAKLDEPGVVGAVLNLVDETSPDF